MLDKKIFRVHIPPVRIAALDSTLVDKHVHSREEVLGSNPTTSTFLPKVFAARWRLLRNSSSKGHHSRYMTPFFKGTYSVESFYELMRVPFTGLKHFLG